MANLIDKDALVTEIKKRLALISQNTNAYEEGRKRTYKAVLYLVDTIEVKDPYQQCVQYDSIKAGIQAHAEEYSFNIESELFNQLTKEQQKLWRKEIEQACISGGEIGVELAKEQMMAKAIDVEVKVDAGGYPYIPQMELYDYDKDIPLAKEGDRYKVVLIKGD